MTCILMKDRKKAESRESHGEKGRDWPPAEEWLEPPKAGRGRKGFSSGALGGSGPADTLISDFWPPELRQNKLQLF